MDISADVGTQRQTLLINQGQFMKTRSFCWSQPGLGWKGLDEKDLVFIKWRSCRYCFKKTNELYFVDISADVGTQRQTLLINQGQSKGKLNLDIVLIELVTWYLIIPFGNVLEWIKKKKRNQWMNCIRCDQRFE